MEANGPLVVQEFLVLWRRACLKSIYDELHARALTVPDMDNLAEDLFQELSLRALQWSLNSEAAGRKALVTHPPAFARKLAHSVVSDWFRAQNARPMASLDVPGTSEPSFEVHTDGALEGSIRSAEYLDQISAILRFWKKGKKGQIWRPAEVIEVWRRLQENTELAAHELGQTEHYIRVNVDRFIQEAKTLNFNVPRCLEHLFNFVYKMGFEEMALLTVPTAYGNISAFLRAQRGQSVPLTDPNGDKALIKWNHFFLLSTLDQDPVLSGNISLCRLVAPGAIATEDLDGANVLRELYSQLVWWAKGKCTENFLLTLGTFLELALRWQASISFGPSAVDVLNRLLEIEKDPTASPFLERLNTSLARIIETPGFGSHTHELEKALPVYVQTGRERLLESYPAHGECWIH